MKKKFLSLMMAAAVVATTSVSAFAATPNVTGRDDQEHETEVTITGDITNKLGHTAPGNLSVTVPTAASFKIDQDGKLTTAAMTITNEGTQKVDVVAYKFIDTTANENIQVVDKNDMATPDNVDRKKIYLGISGNRSIAYFRTETLSTENGIYDASNQKAEQGVTIATVSPQASQPLTLSGAGGKNETLETGINDKFTLVLKIKKSAGQ